MASIFVSRIDTAIDAQLDQKIKASNDTAEQEKLRTLQGKAAIANGKATYGVYQELYATPRFAALRAKGAHPQRLLWASTSVKNPAFPDLLYVEALIGPETVDTMPPATVTAFMDHGIHRLGSNQSFDIQQIRERWIFDAGRCPQQALWMCTFCA